MKKLPSYINGFWQLDAENPFSLAETKLYFFLLEKAIESGSLKESFFCSLLPIMLPKVLPKMTLLRARDKLQQRGLIQYVSGNGKSKKPCYFVCDVTKVVTNNVTIKKEKVSPTPPLKENIIKENSSKEELKKAELPSPKPYESCPRAERMDWCAFMQTFNDMLAPAIPRIVGINESRRQRVKAIIKEFGKGSIMEVLTLVRQSDFLTGHNNTGWRCDFDWIFKKSNYLKILEGNYNNNSNGTENRRANYTSKQEVNEYAYNQFLAKRAAKEQGLVIEVENPF